VCLGAWKHGGICTTRVRLPHRLLRLSPSSFPQLHASHRLPQPIDHLLTTYCSNLPSSHDFLIGEMADS
jgi:hypothetical protein